MKIPTVIVSLVFTAIITMQGWALVEIVNLKVAVASINTQLQLNNKNLASK